MPAHNLSKLACLLDRYDAMMTAKDTKGLGNRADHLLKRFFDDHFFSMGDIDLDEAEDGEEGVPAGSVSFITIHQSKGLEFPVVVACSLFASLCFTGAKAGKQALYRYPVTPEGIEQVLDEFDNVARQIEAQDFAGCATVKQECKNCLLKAYCGR